MSLVVTSGAPTAEPAAEPAGNAGNAAVVARVDAALHAFLDAQRPVIEAAGPDLGAVADAASAFVFAGGKRMRPLFAYWGWRCVHSAGAADEDAVITAAAALELLHAAALVHDDLIDESDTRRGHPAAHVHFAGVLLGASAADRAAFGDASAILLGDLLLSWSWAMLGSAALTPAAAGAARESLNLMSAEMMAGQYLDVLEQSRGEFSVEAALRVARFKSSKYTVERPLLLGAGAGGAGEDVLRGLSGYGVALGEAFQLRDDLLGVFGDPQVTGKPAGDDLREGKRTVLVALAHASARPAARAGLQQALGNPALDAAGIDTARELILSTGAVADVEKMISQRLEQALTALDTAVIRPDARQALTALAQAATARQY